MSGLMQMAKLGMTHVSHEEMVEFAECYPWKTEWRFKNSQQPSWGCWEPPRHGSPAYLVAIKKFMKGYEDFSSKGECFVLLNPDYSDDNGREWRKEDGRLLCVIATAGQQTREGETFTKEELMSVSGAKDRCRYKHSKLLFDMSLLGGKPPYLERGKEGILLSESN